MPSSWAHNEEKYVASEQENCDGGENTQQQLYNNNNKHNNSNHEYGAQQNFESPGANEETNQLPQDQDAARVVHMLSGPSFANHHLQDRVRENHRRRAPRQRLLQQLVVELRRRGDGHRWRPSEPDWANRLLHLLR